MEVGRWRVDLGQIEGRDVGVNRVAYGITPSCTLAALAGRVCTAQDLGTSCQPRAGFHIHAVPGPGGQTGPGKEDLAPPPEPEGLKISAANVG